MSEKNKTQRQKFDSKIMEQLLAEPAVAQNVAKMTGKEIEFFKDLLVSQGIYQRYALEQQKKAVKQALKDTFPQFVKG